MLNLHFQRRPIQLNVPNNKLPLEIDIQPVHIIPSILQPFPNQHIILQQGVHFRDFDKAKPQQYKRIQNLIKLENLFKNRSYNIFSIIIEFIR